MGLLFRSYWRNVFSDLLGGFRNTWGNASCPLKNCLLASRSDTAIFGAEPLSPSSGRHVEAHVAMPTAALPSDYASLI
jgi:hypothetical protein